jgi:hypothetical protein
MRSLFDLIFSQASKLFSTQKSDEKPDRREIFAESSIATLRTGIAHGGSLFLLSPDEKKCVLFLLLSLSSSSQQILF